MYEILVYLFENYQHPAAFPERKALFRKLSAVGFENHDIQEALSWLGKLQIILSKTEDLDFSSLSSFRIFDKDEVKYFDYECQNFLFFLESAQGIDARSRELIIELSLALKDPPITLENLKVITLIALWYKDRMPNVLILDELLTDYPNTLH